MLGLKLFHVIKRGYDSFILGPQLVIKHCSPGPCITNVFATRRKNFSQWHRSFQRKLRSHWLKFLRHVAITLVIQGPVEIALILSVGLWGVCRLVVLGVVLLLLLMGWVLLLVWHLHGFLQGRHPLAVHQHVEDRLTADVIDSLLVGNHCEVVAVHLKWDGQNRETDRNNCRSAQKITGYVTWIKVSYSVSGKVTVMFAYDLAKSENRGRTAAAEQVTSHLS